MRKEFIILTIIFIVLVLGLFVNFLIPPSIGLTYQPPRTDFTVPLTKQITQTITQPTALTERMIIYSARLWLEVDDISRTMEEISSLARSMGGYVVGSWTSILDSKKSGTISIRVPKDNFHLAINTIESMGKLKEKSTSSDDVTEQYIDLKARLGNLQVQEETLRNVLRKAETVRDILDVYKELERVRGEIESLTGKLNYLERSVEMSLITVNLIESGATPVEFPKPDWGEVLNTAILALYWTLRGIVILIFGLAPIAVVPYR
ncbi:MAG: DUF4349 domain-containing protein [Nitrososphaerota archaeon]